MKAETKNLHNNGKDKRAKKAIALLDSGCTMEAISLENGTNSGPEGPPVNGTDTHTIGTKGSKSWINHGHESMQ